MKDGQRLCARQYGIIYVPTERRRYGIVVAYRMFEKMRSDVTSTYGGDANGSVMKCVFPPLAPSVRYLRRV